MIRAATMDDLPAINALYNDLGVGTLASYAWEPMTDDERQTWLRDARAHDWPVFVATDLLSVIGFASYSPFRPREGYRHTVEHSVYVDAAHQGRGVGKALMGALISHARVRGVHAMVGVIDASNAASRAFHENLGFTTAGVLPEVGRKFDRWLDVAFLVFVIDDEAPLKNPVADG